jgi:hypothetical protein
MICLLFMAGFGHSFIDGYYKSCLYKCEDDTRRYYRVDPDYICPKRIKDD